MIYRHPFALLELTADSYGLTGLRFITEETAKQQQAENDASLESPNQFIRQAITELDEYFDGQRTEFSVKLHIPQGTAFQQRVWQALQAIPYGETRTYQDIAEAAGSPDAVRAVGQANKQNPVAIIIPCHRVIGKNGKLTGYMGSGEQGILLKQKLLQHEAVTANKRQS
ncbi:methylated-DNA--[protein]-cysteine S-methyltransferase [Vagococcus acidifermentans]|uniref:Methylated-DNA--protein-cysteine methyltransferase n=1 Tax=Vagococcus acidifermentans TaxID=564710 RepID=A0A430B0E1_9ENTE|nr:methylated-DNA--[protein]-cysteine S-methyltransferase [Vagococcus acidifermentans]RSU13813.1 hypothetical protein CBF27_02630 [Vagococcus acidifermentans]